MSVIFSKPKFNPSRGGHAPGHLRDRFCELIEYDESDIDVKGDYPSDVEMAGMLWNCTDIMPGAVCVELDLSRGSTYAQGARTMRN